MKSLSKEARMKSLSTLLLVGLLSLVGVVEARATDQAAFLAKLKAVGVTSDPLTSKKPCLCVGAQLIGVLIAIPNIKGPIYGYDCSIPSFNPDGSAGTPASCLSAGGAVTVLPLSK